MPNGVVLKDRAMLCPPGHSSGVSTPSREVKHPTTPQTLGQRGALRPHFHPHTLPTPSSPLS